METKSNTSKMATTKAVRERLSAFAAEMGRAGRGASKVRGDSDHYRAIRAKRRMHIPAPGRAVGLRGEALCGALKTYLTGDHDQIRRQARADGTGYCSRCLAALAR